ncbi:hypothetical protein KY290_030987 [Solanum tuberosum]|uniref:At2g35280-like TPR domain-containing protein n=1 Tax=Solanum tuberosum TaxID=4113 RepID=A0ABQ7U8R1_SOLTU|nr:hypothetical protein KY290_030987 [Solanum tuberosum]
MLNNEYDDVDMNNHDAEIGKDDVPDFESHNPPIPIVGSNIPYSSQSSRVNNVRDDETGFYKGMTFKNKEELTSSLKIACLKKDFGLKKGMEHAKSNVRGTHEHKYAVLNAYCYMLEVANPGKMRKVIAVDGTFLRSKHPCIRNVVSTIYHASHYGCCMRYLGENIQNNFHNSKAVTHFYKVAKAYDRCEFNDHFNQIRDLVPKAAEPLERIGFHPWSRAFCPGNSSRVLNEVANEPSVHQKVTLVSIPYRRWSIVQEAISFLEMCRASENLEALYRKGVFDFFNSNDPIALGMINQAADGGHIGASYVLAIISIFNGGESMREGGMWVPEPHLLGGRPIYCTVHQFEQIRRRNGWPMGSDNEDDIRFPGSSMKSLMNLLFIRRASGNLEALYRKDVYDFFKRSNSNGLEILSQAADGGHIGASYVLAIISIFNGSESMREGIMFIANMTPLKLRRCREKLLYTLYGWVPEPHLLGERPICCTIQNLHFRCELCRVASSFGGLVTECMGSSDPPPFKKEWTIQVEDFGLVHAIVRMHATSLDGGIVKMLIFDPSSLF